MDIDDRFDYSDTPWYIENNGVFDHSALTDEELLENWNWQPRAVKFEIDYLDSLEEEIKLREILVPNDWKLSDLTDDKLAERRYQIKLELAVIKKQEDALKAERESIDSELMERFEKRGTSGTKAARFTISVKEDANYPELYDRTEFENYLLSTGKIHLLQKRLSLSSIQEELAALKEEYKIFEQRLNSSVNKNETAEQIYFELFGNDSGENEHLKEKINVLKQTNSIVSTLQQELKDYYTIPGVHVVSKKSIISVKRG